MEKIELTVVETHGIDRVNEPIAFGLPMAKETVTASDTFILQDESGSLIPHETKCLASWNDASVKWLLFQLALDMEANTSKKVKIELNEKQKNGKVGLCKTPITYIEENDVACIQTGPYLFSFRKTGVFSINELCVNDVKVLEKSSECILKDDEGMVWQPWIGDFECERLNNLVCILSFSGHFRSGEKTHNLNFLSKCYIYAGSGDLRIDFTLWNPNAAEHKGGAWDLGDNGSILFKGLHLNFPLNIQETKGIYAVKPGSTGKEFHKMIQIYQDSSGGDHWNSKNHINRYNEIPLSFKGYHVVENGDVVEKGNRATPMVFVKSKTWTAGLTVPYFWENFPKSLSCNDGLLCAHIFPEAFGDLFEIQGGEQKTHTILFNVSDNPEQNPMQNLYWAHHPVEVHIDPNVFDGKGFSPNLVPSEYTHHDELYKEYQTFVSTAIHGDRSFFKKREMIDEYGWRNFGDLYADHEAVMHNGDGEFISHYNNQYDVIKGAIFQFMRTGDSVWWRLGREKAMHVSDIDIYRTDQDRYQYNSGLFWHTDHHLDAATSTHRTISLKHLEFKDQRFFGGGPATHHVYSTGLCYLYWMTGESRYKESASRLIQYIENAIQGPDTLMELGLNIVRNGIRKIKGIHSNHIYGLDGPGRGSGNALNTMIDGYLLTSKTRYLDLAEKLIRMCIAPDDDIASRELLNSEYRWMYTVFLQSLGRYLDIAGDIPKSQNFYSYAKESFLYYAQWMLENEYPYLEKPEILEFPNETWPAQDLRKADILSIASRYCDNKQSSRYAKKSRYFFEKCFEHMKNFGEARFLTRPIVIVMTNGFYALDMSYNRCKVSTTGMIQHHQNKPWKKLSLISKIREFLNRLFRTLRKTSLIKELRWIKMRLNKSV